MPDDVIDLTRPPLPPQPASRPVAPARMFSPLDALAERIGQRKAKPKLVAVEVPDSGGWVVEYNAHFDLDLLAIWRTQALDAGDDGDTVNQGLFHRIILVNQCRRMIFNGEPAADEQGKPLTFASQRLWEVLGLPLASPDGATEAVRRLYDNDFAVSATASKVLEVGGFGQGVKVDPDPTRRR